MPDWLDQAKRESQPRFPVISVILWLWKKRPWRRRKEKR